MCAMRSRPLTSANNPLQKVCSSFTLPMCWKAATGRSSVKATANSAWDHLA